MLRPWLLLLLLGGCCVAASVAAAAGRMDVYVPTCLAACSNGSSSSSSCRFRCMAVAVAAGGVCRVVLCFADFKAGKAAAAAAAAPAELLLPQ
jgi:hypothetical protein